LGKTLSGLNNIEEKGMIIHDQEEILIL